MEAADVIRAVAEDVLVGRTMLEHYGTVALVSEGSVSVELDGSESATECTTRLVECHVGDRVLVTIDPKTRRATVKGNITAPSTDDAQALVAVDRADAAKRAADAAAGDARAAKTSADSAQASAKAASDAVELIEGRVAASEAAIVTIDGNVSRVETETEAAIETIRGDVSVISGYVADAQAAAGRAETAASGAQAAASEAVAGLGRVEDVVGTVTWLGEHSAPTSDTSPVPGKTYYEKRPDGRLVAVDDVPSNPAQAGLYELTDSVQRYLSTHLALTDEGLVVASDGSSNRLLLTESAMRFQDAYKLDVAYIEVDPVTNVSVFYITKSVVLKELRFGMFKFFERVNGNMGFKYVGEGV